MSLTFKDIQIGVSYLYFHQRNRADERNAQIITITGHPTKGMSPLVQVFRGTFIDDGASRSVMAEELFPIPELLKQVRPVKPHETQPKDNVKLIKIRT